MRPVSHTYNPVSTTKMIGDAAEMLAAYAETDPESIGESDEKVSVD